MEILGIVLGSSVVAGIISALLSLYSNNRQNTLTRVTDERSKWRTSLKEITCALEEHRGDPDKTKLDLAKLQAQLNPYGKFNTEKNKNAFYYHDGPIWKAIEAYDGGDQDKLNILQERVYLALKYDWERSKEEIRTNIALVLSFVLAAVGGVFLYMNVLGTTSVSFSIDLIMVCIYVIALTSYPLVATRFQSLPVTIVVVIAEVAFLILTFSTLHLGETTGILALSFYFFSILAMAISGIVHLQIRRTFIKASKQEYKATGNQQNTITGSGD